MSEEADEAMGCLVALVVMILIGGVIFWNSDAKEEISFEMRAEQSEEVTSEYVEPLEGD